MTAPDVRTAAQREPNYNRICAECEYGHDCSQPYESADGSVYWCKQIFQPVSAKGSGGQKH